MLVNKFPEKLKTFLCFGGREHITSPLWKIGVRRDFRSQTAELFPTATTALTLRLIQAPSLARQRSQVFPDKKLVKLSLFAAVQIIRGASNREICLPTQRTTFGFSDDL